MFVHSILLFPSLVIAVVHKSTSDRRTTTLVYKNDLICRVRVSLSN